MIKVPDINLMREVAEEENSTFNEKFGESEMFAKMCADIQEEANKGNFSKLFGASGYGGPKSIAAAKKLFLEHGYNAKILEMTLIVSWGINAETKNTR